MDLLTADAAAAAKEAKEAAAKNVIAGAGVLKSSAAAVAMARNRAISAVKTLISKTATTIKGAASGTVSGGSTIISMMTNLLRKLQNTNLLKSLIPYHKTIMITAKTDKLLEPIIPDLERLGHLLETVNTTSLNVLTKTRKLDLKKLIITLPSTINNIVEAQSSLNKLTDQTTTTKQKIEDVIRAVNAVQEKYKTITLMPSQRNEINRQQTKKLSDSIPLAGKSQTIKESKKEKFIQRYHTNDFNFTKVTNPVALQAADKVKQKILADLQTSITSELSKKGVAEETLKAPPSTSKNEKLESLEKELSKKKAAFLQRNEGWGSETEIGKHAEADTIEKLEKEIRAITGGH
jgi:hypothetical protein